MRTLLVAEDDVVLLEALQGLLRLEGYEVIGVRTAEDGARLLASCVVDAAVVDWWLCGDSSDELLAALIEHGIPAVLLSGDPDARAVAEELGIPWVHKPFVVEQLVGILSGAISRRTLRRTAVSRLGG